MTKDAPHKPHGSDEIARLLALAIIRLRGKQNAAHKPLDFRAKRSIRVKKEDPNE